jgi:N-acetyl-anhydromuramyl-L-alanine amidase AmpD
MSQNALLRPAFASAGFGGNTVEMDCPPRASNTVIINGQRVAVEGACVVNFLDDPSWDFRRLVHADPNRQYVYQRKTADRKKMASTWDEIKEAVDMVVIHSDITYTSRSCFNVLRARGFSTHFMVDWDGTIYQSVDAGSRAVHAACDFITDVNNRSIGIDMNCFQSNFINRSDASPTGPMIDQFAKPGGKRRLSEVIEINGSPWKSWGFTDPQYVALIKLLQVLVARFDIAKTAPVTETGEIVWQVPDDDTCGEAGKSIGIWGHLHLKATKADPGPGFDWKRVLAGLVQEHNAFPLELVEGKSIESLLTEQKVNRLAKVYYDNTEKSDIGGYYPVGLGGQWHGGIHLHAPEGAPVKAMFDGVIVAARNGKRTNRLGSTNFVLIKHVQNFGSKDAPREFVFFSLYMHIAEFDPGVPLHKKPNIPEHPDAAPEWFTLADTVKTGRDEQERLAEKAALAAAERKKKKKRGRKKRKKARPEDESDEHRDDDLDDEDEDDEEFDDDEEQSEPWLDEDPFLKVATGVNNLKQGHVALFRDDGRDETKVAANTTIGRVGDFGNSDGSLGTLHVEIFADSSWEGVIDLLGVHGAHWTEMQADTDDNLMVNTDDMLNLVLPDWVNRKRSRNHDYAFAGAGVPEDDITDFYSGETSGATNTKFTARMAITRHVSEWSDKVDWIRAMIGQQGWDEATKSLAAMLKDERGKYLRTMFAKQIRDHLAFIWLTDEVAEHIGLQEFDGLLYYFHPVNFLLWMTFHTNTRVRVLAKGRSRKELVRLRKKEQRESVERKKNLEFSEDYDHGDEFDAEDFADVDEPEDVLGELWHAGASPNDWEFRD